MEDAASGARSQGVVLTHASGTLAPRGHERLTHASIARRLARLLGYDFGGDLDPAALHPGRRYLVPSDTLVGTRAAAALGVRDANDLFGAVVPHAFVATKSITHRLVDGAQYLPEGWQHGFAADVRDDVLAGYSAFCLADAERAAHTLLARGPVRLKRATGIGGAGQEVLRSAADVAAALARLDAAELARYGCVLEEQLEHVTTCSVGRVEVGGLVATYCGTQCLTRNNDGHEVYGGSDLLVVRGEFGALLALPLPAALAEAVAQARRYDAAADAHFPGFLASRRNYDVAQGIDTEGTRRSGVLEQSWRIGGASGAEVGALEVFQADDGPGVVRARSVEVYGAGYVPPAEAQVLFQGVDARAGPLTKYVIVERHADAG